MELLFLLRHEVDKSLLKEGFSIPQSAQAGVYNALGRRLDFGQSVDILLLWENQAYPAKLTNLGFDREDYKGHTDILQVRYPADGALSEQLRAAFPATCEKVRDFYEHRDGSRKLLKIPENEKEFVSLWLIPETHILLMKKEG